MSRSLRLNAFYRLVSSHPVHFFLVFLIWTASDVLVKTSVCVVIEISQASVTSCGASETLI